MSHKPKSKKLVLFEKERSAHDAWRAFFDNASFLAQVAGSQPQPGAAFPVHLAAEGQREKLIRSLDLALRLSADFNRSLDQ